MAMGLQKPERRKSFYAKIIPEIIIDG